MPTTVSPEREKYPDSVGGCPPGTHFWSGYDKAVPLAPKPPACIVDPPPPTCPNGYPVEEWTRLADRSLPMKWHCQTCPDGTIALKMGGIFSSSPQEWQCWSPPPPEPPFWHKVVPTVVGWAPSIGIALAGAVLMIMLFASLRRGG